MFESILKSNSIGKIICSLFAVFSLIAVLAILIDIEEPEEFADASSEVSQSVPALIGGNGSRFARFDHWDEDVQVVVDNRQNNNYLAFEIEEDVALLNDSNFCIDPSTNNGEWHTRANDPFGISFNVHYGQGTCIFFVNPNQSASITLHVEKTHDAGKIRGINVNAISLTREQIKNCGNYSNDYYTGGTPIDPNCRGLENLTNVDGLNDNTEFTGAKYDNVFGFIHSNDNSWCAKGLGRVWHQVCTVMGTGTDSLITSNALGKGVDAVAIKAPVTITLNTGRMISTKPLGYEYFDHEIAETGEIKAFSKIWGWSSVATTTTIKLPTGWLNASANHEAYVVDVYEKSDPDDVFTEYIGGGAKNITELPDKKGVRVAFTKSDCDKKNVDKDICIPLSSQKTFFSYIDFNKNSSSDVIFGYNIYDSVSEDATPVESGELTTHVETVAAPQNDQKYVKDVYFGYGKTCLSATSDLQSKMHDSDEIYGFQSVTVIDEGCHPGLNEGANSDTYIVMGYTKTGDRSNAITDIQACYANSWTLGSLTTCDDYSGDLSKGSGSIHNLGIARVKRVRDIAGSEPITDLGVAVLAKNSQKVSTYAIGNKDFPVDNIMSYWYPVNVTESIPTRIPNYNGENGILAPNIEKFNANHYEDNAPPIYIMAHYEGTLYNRDDAYSQDALDCQSDTENNEIFNCSVSISEKLKPYKYDYSQYDYTFKVNLPSTYEIVENTDNDDSKCLQHLEDDSYKVQFTLAFSEYMCEFQVRSSEQHNDLFTFEGMAKLNGMALSFNTAIHIFPKLYIHCFTGQELQIPVAKCDVINRDKRSAHKYVINVFDRNNTLVSTQKGEVGAGATNADTAVDLDKLGEQRIIKVFRNDNENTLFEYATYLVKYLDRSTKQEYSCYKYINQYREDFRLTGDQCKSSSGMTKPAMLVGSAIKILEPVFTFGVNDLAYYESIGVW